MDLDSDEIGDLLKFTYECPYIFQVRQQGIRILIGLPAKCRVAVEAESVVKTSRLALGLFHKSFADPFNLLHFPAVYFEIWSDANASVLSNHHLPPNLSLDHDWSPAEA